MTEFKFLVKWRHSFRLSLFLSGKNAVFATSHQHVGLNPKYQQNLDTDDNPFIGKIQITVCEFYVCDFFHDTIVRPLTVHDDEKTLLHI